MNKKSFKNLIINNKQKKMKNRKVYKKNKFEVKWKTFLKIKKLLRKNKVL